MLVVKIFAEGVAKKIKDYLPEEYQNMKCSVTEQQKNNGTVQVGLLLEMTEQKISPVVYMESFYDQVRQGKPLEQIMEQIADVCMQSLSVRELPEEPDFMNYDSMKEHLSVQIINTKANQKMLSKIPHQNMEDLSVICRVEFPTHDGMGVGSMKVSYELMKQWGVHLEEVYPKALENAVKNSPPIFMTMDAALSGGKNLSGKMENLFQLEEGTGVPQSYMYVLSNPMGMNGATVLAYPDIQKQLDEILPQGYYILPSSVHEVLIVPKDDNVTPKMLGEMVREVNRVEVSKDEFLSDRVYEFDKETKRLRQIPESIEKSRGMER